MNPVAAVLAAGLGHPGMALRVGWATAIPWRARRGIPLALMSSQPRKGVAALPKGPRVDAWMSDPSPSRALYSKTGTEVLRTPLFRNPVGSKWGHHAQPSLTAAAWI